MAKDAQATDRAPIEIVRLEARLSARSSRKERNPLGYWRMEGEIEIHIPEDSALSAYGVASLRRSWFFILPGAILLVFVLVVGLLWFLLSRPFLLPEQTAFLLTARPKTVAQHFSAETLSSLPEPWQTTLQSRSSWPVVLGAYLKDGRWQPFVLTPRWLPSSLGQPKQTRGLALLIGDPAISSSYSINYRQAFWSWFKRVGGYATGEIDLSPFSLSLEQSSSTIHFVVYRDRIQTDLSFHREKQSLANTSIFVTQDQDISLDLRRLMVSPFYSSLLHTLHWGDAELANLSAPPAQAAFSFGEKNVLKKVDLIFEQELSKTQKEELLAYTRFVGKAVMRLPDGSLAVERRFPNLSGTSSTSFSTALGDVSLDQDRAQMVQAVTSSTQTGEPIPSCLVGNRVARLSPRALRLFTQELSLDLPSDFVSRGVQFIERKNYLNICLE